MVYCPIGLSPPHARGRRRRAILVGGRHAVAMVHPWRGWVVVWRRSPPGGRGRGPAIAGAGRGRVGLHGRPAVAAWSWLSPIGWGRAGWGRPGWGPCTVHTAAGRGGIRANGGEYWAAAQPGGATTQQAHRAPNTQPQESKSGTRSAHLRSLAEARRCRAALGPSRPCRSVGLSSAPCPLRTAACPTGST